MVFVTDDKKGILATISDTGMVYVPPAASRDEVAFILFKVMLELMQRPITGYVTGLGNGVGATDDRPFETFMGGD